jgi:hypothetical protein
VSGDFRLWGTFSVADHKRRHAFVADVLVYDRLIIPVPAGDDDDRWARNEWDVNRQRRFLDVLRDGDDDRVVEVPWDRAKRDVFKERTTELAAAAAFDVSVIDSVARDNPDTPAQYIARMVLQDYVDAAHDAELLSGVLRGLPRTDVQVVAAYQSWAQLTDERDVEEIDSTGASGADLLGGFVWPFIVPAEQDRSDIDLLKRAVEFANRPEVQAYRLAFHQWRNDVVRGGKTPREAAENLGAQISEYGEWSRKLKVQTATRTACAVVALGATVAGSAVLPFIGVPTLAASLVGAGGAGVGLVDFIASRLFRQGHAGTAANQPGALFWEARTAIR